MYGTSRLIWTRRAVKPQSASTFQLCPLHSIHGIGEHPYHLISTVLLTLNYSKIILVLLSSGEAYIVDLRREYRGRYELCEVQDESDDESQMSRATRY